MTLLAVTRQSRDGRNRIGTIGRCGVGSGSFGRCSGDCWPASHMVALAGVAASGREHAIRVRGRATTVIPEAATPGLPGESGPNRAPLGVGPNGWSSHADLELRLPLAGGLGPGPL